MKKNSISCFFILLISTIVFAQNTNLKRYSSVVSGEFYSGYAVALHFADITEFEQTKNIKFNTEQDFIAYIIEDCKMNRITKLNKKNNWLYKQALNEWDYSKGEIYVVLCAESNNPQEAICLFVIVKGKDDFLWCAYLVNNDTDFSDLFWMLH